MRLVATCPEETRPALEQELRTLGARNLEPAFRAVAFDADEALFYELHLKLRTASRILRVLKEVPARSAPMLRSQARRIHWHELFPPEYGFMVETLGGEEELAPKQVVTQVREAVFDEFERSVGQRPRVDVEAPRVVVVAHVSRGRCTLCLDTTGKSLHKRGYRESGHPAPLKETMAAAILQLAQYDGSEAFLDPMCGSGTLAIEAAMVAVRKAPQIHRRKGEFHFEWLKDFDRALWRTTQERVRAEKLDAPPAPVVASDVNPQFVAMARKSALKARVERYITFEVGRFQDRPPPAERGVIVTNLPYGERIGGDERDLRVLYDEVGDTLKQRYAGWRAVILAADPSPWKAIGLKPGRSIPLMNGRIPCRLLFYDLYAGSRGKSR